MLRRQNKPTTPTQNVFESLNRSVEELIAAARAETIFGPTVQQGDTTVVPCAESLLVVGVGVGGGNTAGNKRAGGGAGLGGTAHTRPVASIVITPDSVRVEPIVDVTRLGLAAITTAGFAVFWLSRLRRATRGKEPSLDNLRRAV